MRAGKIKKIREKMGMTQEQFAQRLGVSFVTVNRWENGKHPPSALARLRIKEIAKRKK
jgi:putative transcriptional regulator